MKIVVITGSPRKNGNSFAMTDAFIKEVEQQGHTVRRFDAAYLKIGGCHACMTCYKTGKACSFDDDFNLIAPAILEADAETVNKCMTVVHKLAKQISENLHCEGLNILNNCNEVAGQSVDHLHFHIIPRYGKEDPVTFAFGKSKEVDLDEVLKDIKG